MLRRIAVVVLVPLTIVTAACAGPDGDAAAVTTESGAVEPTDSAADSSSVEPDPDGTPQDAVATMVMEMTSGEFVELRPDCVREAISAMSDADAEAIVAERLDGSPDVSAEGETITLDAISDCVDTTASVRALAESLRADDPGLDVDCVVDAVEGVPYEDVGTEVVGAVEGCTG